MNILLQSKKEIEKVFQTSMLFRKEMLGMILRGEETWMIPSKSMNEGYEIIVGFFQERARYVAFRKVLGKGWEDADMRAGMLLIGRLARWKMTTNSSGNFTSDFVDYVEREGDKADGPIIAEATGWQNPAKGYSFFYVPVISGGVPLLPDKSSLDKQLGSTTSGTVTIVKPGRRSATASPPRRSRGGK